MGDLGDKLTFTQEHKSACLFVFIAAENIPCKGEKIHLSDWMISTLYIVAFHAILYFGHIVNLNNLSNSV